MLNKKILILATVLVSLLAVSAVSGADNGTGDAVGTYNTNDGVISIEEGYVISQTDNDVIEDNGNGTFTELQEMINGSDEGATITLDRDYVYDDGFDTMGIEFRKAITIDGNGHVIDARSKSTIFYSSADSADVLPNYTVVLKNVKLINSYYSSGASAIYDWRGANFNIISCSFINCTASDIYFPALLFVKNIDVSFL